MSHRKARVADLRSFTHGLSRLRSSAFAKTCPPDAGGHALVLTKSIPSQSSHESEGCWFAGRRGLPPLIRGPHGRLRTAPTPLNGDSTFLNDHETLPDGSVVFTDSYRPYLWRGEAEGGRLEAYVYLDSAGVDYGPGFNFNGVVLGAGGTALVAAQTNTKQLWRIDLDTRAVEEVTLDTPLESGGDGMRLGPDDRTLYVVDGGAISVYALGADARSARRTGRTTSPTFDSPTAAAFGIGADSARLYVVNSQFAARAGKEPLSLPFEVVTVGR